MAKAAVRVGYLAVCSLVPRAGVGARLRHIQDNGMQELD